MKGIGYGVKNGFGEDDDLLSHLLQVAGLSRALYRIVTSGGTVWIVLKGSPSPVYPGSRERCFNLPYWFDIAFLAASILRHFRWMCPPPASRSDGGPEGGHDLGLRRVACRRWLAFPPSARYIDCAEVPLLVVHDMEALLAVLASIPESLPRPRAPRRPRKQQPRPPARECIPIANIFEMFAPQEPRKYKPSLDRPPTLNLADRWLDVRKICKSQAAFRGCLRAGWDPDDLVSEVFARVLARQSMKSRYDPERACVSKYLTVICTSILLNLLDIAKRRSKHEQLGSNGPDGEPCDAALTACEV